MATKIKLTRIGKMREPHYRVVIADARTKRDGRSIETIGEYHPKSDPSIIVVDGARAAYWLGVGAQPTEAVVAILKVTGDWQKFKGLPEPPPMLMAPAKPDKRALFDAALAETSGDSLAEAVTPKKKAAPKKAAAEPAPAEASSAVAPAEGAPAESAPAEAAPSESAPAEAASSEAEADK